MRVGLGTLLLDQRSIDLSGSREKEGHFLYKNFESFDMRYHLLYLLHHPQIPLLWKLNPQWDHQAGMACDASFRSSQKVFIIKVAFFFFCTTNVD